MRRNITLPRLAGIAGAGFACLCLICAGLALQRGEEDRVGGAPVLTRPSSTEIAGPAQIPSLTSPASVSPSRVTATQPNWASSPVAGLKTTPASTPTLALTEAGLSLPSFAACIPAGTTRQTGEVTGVVDGDTIDVLMDGVEYRIRYIGMDSPERGDLFYDEAAAENSGLVLGRTVVLVKDVSETDRYGRLLRYVLVEDVFVNDELVRSGFALVSTYPPDVACQGAFQDAQAQAQAEGAGLWQLQSTAAPTSVGEGGGCDPSYPTVCIPPPPPDLDCKDIPYRRFQVTGSDPHGFDGDGDGVGCES